MLQILNVKKILMNVINFCTREKKSHAWKFSKITHILPVKNKTHPWKYPKKCPWKLWTAREKFEKSVRESDFAIREKSRKKA